MSDLAALAAQVAEQTDRYLAAQQAESMARSACISALNALNAAQRQLDAALAQLRQAAPPSTDWCRNRKEP